MGQEELMKVVNKYLTKEGKILQYPSKKSVRPYVLAYIAGKFTEGEKYTEKQVNEIIRNNIEFSDHELIRRELFTYRYLNRLRDGSAYWLEEKQPEILEKKD